MNESEFEMNEYKFSQIVALVYNFDIFLIAYSSTIFYLQKIQPSRSSESRPHSIGTEKWLKAFGQYLETRSVTVSAGGEREHITSGKKPNYRYCLHRFIPKGERNVFTAFISIFASKVTESRPQANRQIIERKGSIYLASPLAV